jgi:hypothetical protein
MDVLAEPKHLILMGMLESLLGSNRGCLDFECSIIKILLLGSNIHLSPFTLALHSTFLHGKPPGMLDSAPHSAGRPNRMKVNLRRGGRYLQQLLHQLPYWIRTRTLASLKRRWAESKCCRDQLTLRNIRWYFYCRTLRHHLHRRSATNRIQ